MTPSVGDGRRFRAFVARTGVPLPPPAGPARIHHCLREGVSELLAVRRMTLRSDALLDRALANPDVGGVLQDGGALRAGRTGAFVAGAGDSRIPQWFALRKQAFAYFESQRALFNEQPFRDYREAGGLIHSALKASGRSYLWLKDVACDLDLNTPVKLGRSEPELGELLDEAHSSVHRLGEIYGGLYGCTFDYDDGIWYQECDVHLPHVPIANSMGFTCRYICTLCGEDASSCQHARGASYEVEVARAEGEVCSLCVHSRESCQHHDGEIVTAVANVMITDIDLREISLVNRARDPLARITSVEVGALELSKRVGRLPVEGERVLCHTCMHPCQHGGRVEGAGGPTS